MKKKLTTNKTKINIYISFIDFKPKNKLDATAKQNPNNKK